MKINFLFLITLTVISSILLTGCSATNSATDNTADNQGQYRKVSLFADVSLTHIPDTSDVLVCLGTGRLSSVMYFDKDGGEYLQQESSFTLSSINCENFGTTKPCTAWTEPGEISIPITLSAELLPDELKATKETSTKDSFTFSIPEPIMNPVDINYNCGGAISSLSDYGATFSQLTIPLNQKSAAISIGEPYITTPPDYKSPGGNIAKMEIGILEEFVDSMDSIKNTQKE